MASSHNNGPPPINYATHLKRRQLPSREATSVQPVSTPQASPTKAKCPQPVAFMYEEPHPQPPPRSSHLFIYEELAALPCHTLIGAQSAASPGAPVAPGNELVVHVDSQAEAPLDSLTDALEGLSIGTMHTAPLATLTAPQAVGVPAPPPPPPVTHALPMPFAHVTPGRRTKKRFYSVTVGKCCGVFNNWNFVTTLGSGVSGSSFSGFNSYQDAVENYYKAKSRGCVRVEREPGDEAMFGPLSQAIM